MTHAKDDLIMIKNFSGALGKVDETALALINACKYVYLDYNTKREYVKDAVSFDNEGNVTFQRRYLNN